MAKSGLIVALSAFMHLLPAGAGAIELEPCGPESSPAEILCGTLTVPENPERPDARKISLHVTLLPALEGRGSGGALFQIDGGPGLAVSTARDFYLGPGRSFRQGRDVVLVDQRGVGGGPEALRCFALEHRAPLTDDYDLAAVRECRQVLEKRADLTQYGTWNAAGDLDVVRSALGFHRIDIWAISYGTKLAQTYMKRFPAHVRTAFLIGTATMDNRTPLLHAASAQRALDALFFDCQADPACRRAYPDLRNDWQQLLARLDREPVKASRPASAGKGALSVEIRRGPFVETLRNQLYMTVQQRRMPFLIHRAAHGDFTPFLELISTEPSPYAEGLYLSVSCAEGSARIAKEDVAAATAGTFLGSYRVESEMAACREWPQRIPPDHFFAPLATNVPVLMVIGTADPVTPPTWSEQICNALPGCRLVSVPYLAHAPDIEAWQGGDCVDRLAMDLYRSGDAKNVDAGCVAAMTPPPFVLPAEGR